MWLQVLQSNYKDDMDNPLWDPLPPELHYNMDRVPLTFVVNHDSTLSTNDDNVIHISVPSDTLRKRQFTMYVVVNAVAYDKCQGFFNIFCKGQRKYFLKHSRAYGMQEVKYIYRIMHGLVLH